MCANDMSEYCLVSLFLTDGKRWHQGYPFAFRIQSGTGKQLAKQRD